jgi:hypothetical protein
MAEGYLGEFPVDIAQSEFKDYTPADWAMYFIGSYGQFDGGHHKAWVLDQVARILKGTPVIVKEARWTGHSPEFRVSTGEPSQEYLDWVETMKAPDEGGEDQYDYDEGTAP